MYSEFVPFFFFNHLLHLGGRGRKITDSRPALSEHRKFIASFIYIVNPIKKLKGKRSDLLKISLIYLKVAKSFGFQ